MNIANTPFTSTPELSVEQRGPVLWLTITREERRNAMSHSVLAGMAQAISGAQTNRDIRAIVITGAGSKAFCAGADLQSAKAFTTDYSEPHGHLAQLLRVAKASTVPLIARVNGACMAGGMGLMSMCDMAVAASHAVFGLPEVKVGVFPAQVLSVLQHLIPRRKLADMLDQLRARPGIVPAVEGDDVRVEIAQPLDPQHAGIVSGKAHGDFLRRVELFLEPLYVEDQPLIGPLRRAFLGQRRAGDGIGQR